jgi:hypothetical protein
MHHASVNLKIRARAGRHRADDYPTVHEVRTTTGDEGLASPLADSNRQ